MLKHLVALIALAVMAAGAIAQVYKCKGADGKVQFSDKPCAGAVQSQLIPDRGSYVTPQQQYEAQQRAARMRNELDAQEEEKLAANATRNAEQQRQEAAAARKFAQTQAASNDADAVANCVRDVERRGASQNVKAEMIAACRTAGLSQRTAGTSGSGASECVKNVERTGASEREKARQIALCHGGDVPPETYPPIRPANVEPRSQTVIKSCSNGKCSDQFGTTYRTDVVGNIVRQDGRRCRQHGKTIECD